MSAGERVDAIVTLRAIDVGAVGTMVNTHYGLRLLYHPNQAALIERLLQAQNRHALFQQHFWKERDE